MEKIRVGIIGMGFGARVHAPLFRQHGGFDVVAVSSVARSRSTELQQETGVANVYQDWRQMLDQEELDLVAVVSTPLLHHEMTLYALEKGVHVLCEKPMAMNVTESEAMMRARDAAGRHGIINFEWRFLPARQKVKEILSSGQLGTILHVRYQGSMPNFKNANGARTGWFNQVESGGGMLGANGSHMVDSLQWWLDDAVQAVSAELPIHILRGKELAAGEEPRTTEDSFQVVGTMTKGATFTLDYLTAARHVEHGWKLEVFGTEGTLVMTDDQIVRLAVGDGTLEAVELAPAAELPATLPTALGRYYPAFYPMVERLYRTLAQGETVADLPLFEDGHRVQKVLDAIRQSAAEGRKVTV